MYPLQKSAPDTVFLVLFLILLAFGTLMNFSAGAVYAKQMYGSETYFLTRTLIIACLALGGSVFFVLFANPAFWRKLSLWLYIAAAALLLLVLLIGTVGGGAKRWLVIGPLTLQPSEVAKTALVLMLARYFADNEDAVLSEKKGSFRYGVLIPGGIFALLGVLIALEKHISGLMILGFLGVSVSILGGMNKKWIAAMGSAVALAGGGLVLVSDYAQKRVHTWLHIREVDPLGEAWQTLQGLYAIGSGGIFGRGLFAGRQKYGYVAEPQNDFVFTILCEELGLLGALFTLGLFLALILRGFSIARRIGDRFSSLVVYGLTLKIAIQTLLNIAVVTNSMPNTGISLPFFSSGGTSLALQIFEMAIILNCSRYAAEYD